jgi:lipoprotein-anchoring transpeptidase ErfK/SrfK
MLTLSLGLAAFAVAGEVINLRDERRLDRLAMIDQLIAERVDAKTGKLRETAQRRTAEVNALQTKVQQVAQQTEDQPDTGQTIVISTAANKLWLKNNGQTVFEAICSTGKGTRLAVDGRTIVFETPIGKLHVKAKEENPEWVPPDWHYIEEARKNGMRVVRLNAGQSIDARTGDSAGKRDQGVWSWFGGGSGGGPVLRVKGDTIVEESGGIERELPSGKTIIAGDAIVIPPINTKQRHYEKVLGKYRLNLGDGYAIHGTDQPEKLGQSVSHGCVRLGDADIERLYQMASVGDTVIIY